MPKRRAASRWLSPSTWQAWRTRPYSSTENIPAFPGSFRTSLRMAMPRYAFVPPRPDYPAASVAYLSSAALMPERVAEELPVGEAQHPGPQRRQRPVRQRRLALGEAPEAGAEQHVGAVLDQGHEADLREGALAAARRGAAEGGTVLLGIGDVGAGGRPGGPG